MSSRTSAANEQQTDSASSAPQQQEPAPESVQAPNVHGLLQRVHDEPQGLSPGDVHSLQRTVGNRATRQLLGRGRPPPAPSGTDDRPAPQPVQRQFRSRWSTPTAPAPAPAPEPVQRTPARRAFVKPSAPAETIQRMSADEYRTLKHEWLRDKAARQQETAIFERFQALSHFQQLAVISELIGGHFTGVTLKNAKKALKIDRSRVNWNRLSEEIRKFEADIPAMELLEAVPEEEVEDTGADTVETVEELVEAATTGLSTFIGNEGISGYADVLSKTRYTSGEVRGLDSDAGEASASDLDTAGNLMLTGDSIVLLKGVIGMVRTLRGAGLARTTAEELENFAEYMASGMSVAEGTSKVISTSASKAGDEDTSKLTAVLGSSFEGLAGVFTTIKNGFSIGRRVFETTPIEDEDYSSTATAARRAQNVLEGLETVKAIVLTIKAFIEATGAGVAGGLMAAIPGLGIAIAGAKIIMEVYYLMKSRAALVKLKLEDVRDAIKTRAGADVTAEQLESERAYYNHKKAQIANLEELVRQDEKAIDSATSTRDRERYVRRQQSTLARIREIRQELDAHDRGDDAIAAEDVAAYDLAVELREINFKRIKRQALHIGTNITTIAGEIGTLSVAGAPVGAALKGAAAGVEGGAVLVRSAKQAGRDRAARKQAKGKSSFFSSGFEMDKSSAAKRARRTALAGQIMDRLLAVPDVELEEMTEPQLVHLDQTIIYMDAVGVDIDKLAAIPEEKMTPELFIKIIFDNLNKRELFE